MEIYYSTLIFVFGLLLGSFYNVVGYRIPNNMSIIKPGSFCPKCKHELKWYELIPVFSFLIQGGKCKKCKCRISFFYPIIESLILPPLLRLISVLLIISLYISLLDNFESISILSVINTLWFKSDANVLVSVDTSLYMMILPNTGKCI